MRIFFFLFFFCSQVFSQNKVLIISNSSDSLEINTRIKDLVLFAKNHNVLIDKHEQTSELSFQKLSNYQSVIFFGFDVNKLSPTESTALVNYFKVGGGLIGINDIFVQTSKFIWFDRIFETKATLKKAELDMIITQSFGFDDISPIWNITDSMVELGKLAKAKKTALVDILGNTRSWIVDTEYGNKCFYTSLGGSNEAFTNQNFLKHLISGINAVCLKTPISDSILSFSNFPKSSNFKSFTLSDKFVNPKIVQTVSDFLIVFTQNGNLFKFLPETKEAINLGQFADLSDAKAITVDPDFEQNNYLYLYFENEMGIKVKRLKLSNLGAEVSPDFESTSSVAISNSCVFSYVNRDSLNYGMPNYFDKKKIKISDEKKLEIITLNDDNQVINTESFVFNLDSLTSFVFNSYGELVYLRNNQLGVLKYNKMSQFAPNVDFDYETISTKPPFKYVFKVKNLNNDLNLNYTWSIDNKVFNGSEINITLLKYANYKVILQAKNEFGLSDTITKMIKIEKKSTIKK